MKTKPKHKYRFMATIGEETVFPKGFYYQKNHIILVGDIVHNHTIRRKERIEDVDISIMNEEFMKWLESRRAETFLEKRNACTLEEQIAKGGKLKAIKEIIAYVRTH